MEYKKFMITQKNNNLNKITLQMVKKKYNFFNVFFNVNY